VGRQTSSLRCIYLYLAGVDNLPVHLGPYTVQIMTEELAYSSVIVITMSMNTTSWIFGRTTSADFGVSKHFKIQTLAINFPVIQFKKRISRNPLMPTSSDQSLKMVLTCEISRDAGKQYSKVR